MKNKKQILKYIVFFIVGFLVGFWTTHEMAKDLVEKRQNRLWGTTAPAHEDVLPDSSKEAARDTIRYWTNEFLCQQSAW